MGKKQPIPALRRHIGGRIRAAREARRLTREDLAGPHLSVNAIARIELGERSPTLETLARIAQAMNLTLEELVASSPMSAPAEVEIGMDRIARALRGQPASIVDGACALVETFLAVVDRSTRRTPRRAPR